SLSYSPYSGVLEKMVALFEQGRNISLIEKLKDNYLITFMKQAKHVMFGIQPIVAFMVAKDMEVKNLRIIITGKQAGLSEDLLKERLRDVYV
ncbi:MAG: V-type ATPase subunit, partial [Chloroflexi bacterium]|nr:V-type ATPase subunit [Chloroflexota bacterium]